MNTAALLLAYATLLATVVPNLLRTAQWVTRSPWLGIVLWEALVVSWLVSLARAAYVLATDGNGTFVSLAGAVAIAAVLGWAACRVGRQWADTRRERRGHANALAFAGHHHAGLGAIVVEHAVPAAYCLPGSDRRRQVVVTSAALQVLDDDQLSAVIAHEQAHLRERHHLISTIANGLYHAFPVVPLFRHARDEIGALIEMAADDVAARRHGRRVLADALVRLARGGQPASALGAGGHTAIRRVVRLLAPSRPLGLPARTAGATTAVSALAFPLSAACVPVVVITMHIGVLLGR